MTFQNLNPFKNVGKYLGLTKCFSRYKGITSFDFKFTESPYRKAKDVPQPFVQCIFHLFPACDYFIFLQKCFKKIS